LVENRDFFTPTLHSMPPLGWSPSEYCHNVWYGKTRMVGLPGRGKMLSIWAVFTEYWRVTDGQMDRWTDGQTSCDGIVRAMHTRPAVKPQTCP